MRQLWPLLLSLCEAMGAARQQPGTWESEAPSSPSWQQCWSLEGRLQGELPEPHHRWPDRPLRQTDRSTQTFCRRDGREEEMGRSRGPRDRPGGGGSRSRGLVEVAGGRHRAGGISRGGWLGPDSRDGWRRTTKDSEMERDNEAHGDRDRDGVCQMASSPASRPE